MVRATEGSILAWVQCTHIKRIYSAAASFVLPYRYERLCVTADLAQRHLKELMQKDLMQVKADVRQEEKFDYAKLHDEITELEKRVRVEYLIACGMY